MFYDDKALEALPTVTFAQLHSELFIPYIGEFGRQFDTSVKSQNAKLRGLKMWACPEGIFVVLGSGHRCMIPYSNVKWCVFNSAEKKAEEPKKSSTVAQDNREKAIKAAGLDKPQVNPSFKNEEPKNPVALDEKTLAAVKASLG